MKTLQTFFAALFLAAIAARADFVIVQQTDVPGKSAEQTIRLKGDQVRTDIGEQISVITNATNGDVVTLMHAQKSYMKISGAQTKAMMEQFQKARAVSEPPKLIATGKKEKVGGYDCDIYTCNLGMMAVTYWIAKDYPNYQALLTQLDKVQSSSLSAMAKGMMPDMKEFPGMAIKTEMDMGGRKITSTLVSVKEETVDPAAFALPADYKEMAMPSMSAPAPTPAE